MDGWAEWAVYMKVDRLLYRRLFHAFQPILEGRFKIARPVDSALEDMHCHTEQHDQKK